MKTLLFVAAIVISTCAVRAQEAPPQPRPSAPVADDGKREVREIISAHIRNLQFDSSTAGLRFSAGETDYIFVPASSSDSHADRIAIGSSLLAELRRSNKISFLIRPIEAGAKQIHIYSMVLHFDSLK